jgi:hypothetical protein
MKTQITATKIRNAIAETVQLMGIAQAAVPQFTAVSHLPAWVGPAVSLAVALGNQWLKDSTPPPTPPAGPVAGP